MTTSVAATDTLIRAAIDDYVITMQTAMQSYDPQLRQATELLLSRLQTSDLLQAQLVLAGALLCGGQSDQTTVLAARSIQIIHEALATEIADTPAASAAIFAAQAVLVNLDVPAECRIKIASITSRSLMLAAQARASRAEMLDARATEATLNPLHVGMVLADADCDATDAVTPYALAQGHRLLGSNERDVAQAFEELRQSSLWSAQDVDHLAYIFSDKI